MPVRCNALFSDSRVVVEVSERRGRQGRRAGDGRGTRHISVTWIAIYRVADGKLAEHWQNIDEPGLK